MKLTKKLVLLMALLSICCGVASAQVATGTPAFGSFGGSADTINLSSLNAHLSIPIMNKPGRGMPFAFSLGYDSSVWTPAGTSGSQTWVPAGTFGWGSGSQVGIGYITAGCSVYSGYITVTSCSGYAYLDSNGTSHPLVGASGQWVGGSGGGLCSNGAANDGSGYTYTLTTSTSSPYVCNASILTSPSGTTSNPIVITNLSGPANVVDSNGNEITLSSGVYTDTLGTTALTIAGSGTPASPTTYSYTAPSGATAKFTVKYTSKTVRTNYGCSGVSEYGPTATNLITEIDLPDQSVNSLDKYTFTYETTPGFSGDVTGRLASMTLPTGGTITYTYTGGSSGHITCADGSAATLWRYTPDTGSNHWTYAHSESGTAWTTAITDPQGNETDVNFQAVSVSSEWQAYETQRQIYQGSAASGALLETVNTCYNAAASPCNSTAITLPIARQTILDQWSPSGSGLVSEVDTTFDAFGGATEHDQYAYSPGAPGPLVRKTVVTYAYMSNNYGFVNKPSIVTVKDASNNIKARTTYCYDEVTPSGTATCASAGAPTPTSGTPQHVSVTGSRGNVTTVASLASGSTNLGKTFTYYDTGNVNVETDFNGAQTIYTYGGCTNSFPTSVSEPLTLSRSMTWNCTGGVTTSVTDENGKISSTSFTDAYFWRPHSSTDPLSVVTNLTYTGQTSVESSMLFNANGSTADTLATADSLGRSQLSQVKQGPSSTTYDSVETDYDIHARQDRSTLPYSGTAGQTSSSAPSTNATFDALGRPTQTTDAGGGSVGYTYAQNDSYQTVGPNPSGENAKRKQLEYDALGRLASVCEITSGTGSGSCGQTSPVTGYWTTYAYDTLDNLTGVTQNAQSASTQTRAYVYDHLGRMTSETNPESGISIYVYDTDATCGTSIGDLVKAVDAVGNTICYGYDALHRMTSTAYSGPYASATPSRYFVYDSATVNGVAMVNTKTRLAEAYTCFSPCTTKLTDIGLSYTARGETSDLYESTPHAGGYYHANQTYWENGVAKQLSGLAGMPTITYNVDGEGRVYSATASSGQNPLSSTTYNVASLPTQVNLGSGDSDTIGYDPYTNRMTQYKFNVNGQSAIGNLGWNALGTLGSFGVTDPFSSADTQTCSYSHDDLVRIASANCGSIWSQTFSYDALGNIQKSGSSSFGATYSASTNQMTQIGSSTPTYDLNGNVTNDFLHSYAWDADGRPVTIDGVSVTYDAFGDVVEENHSGSYAQFVYAPSGGELAIMAGSTLQKGFVPLTGGSTAVYNSSGLAYYRHSDWLGSSRFASTPSRAMYSDGGYGPFGEPYAQTGTTDLSFTGMNQDTSANLYDFPAREYGIQGRWPSPDPSGISSVDPTDPQSWNRYAYVRNNPLASTDPTGEDCISAFAYWTAGACSTGYTNPDGTRMGCMMDNFETDCSVALGFVAAGGAGFCPYVSCTGLRMDANGNFWAVKWVSVKTADSAQCSPNALCTVTMKQWSHWEWTMVHAPQPANNDSWAWAFTKSFFGNFVSLKFYKSELGEGGCLNTFLEGMDQVDPLSKIVPPNSPIMESTIKGGAAAMAAEHAASRGLIYPMRSSIVRGILEKGETAANVFTVGFFDVQAGAGVLKEARAALKGTCH